MKRDKKRTAELGLSVDVMKRIIDTNNMTEFNVSRLDIGVTIKLSIILFRNYVRNINSIKFRGTS